MSRPHRNETNVGNEIVISAILALCATSLYVFSAPKGLSWLHWGTDAGDLITAAITNGVPHPSGYPLYTYLAAKFSFLPLGQNIAHRFNLFSAFCAGITLFFLGLSLQRKGATASTTAYSLISLAVTPLFWSQAIITEVYALNLALLSITLFSFTVAKDSAGRFNPLFWGITAFFAGTALTTHLSSGLFLLLIATRAMLTTRTKELFSASSISIITISFILGLWPLLLLIPASNRVSPVIWGDLHSFEGIWWLISGKLYQPNLFGLSALDAASRLRSWIELSIRNGSWLVWSLPLVGFGLSSIRDRDLNLWPEMMVFIFYIIYGLFYNTGDAIVFILPGLICLAIIAAQSLKKLSWAYILLPILLLSLNLPMFLTTDVDDIQARVFLIYSKLPEDSLVITDGTDKSIFTLWYFRFVELEREDIFIVDQNLFAFDWYRNRLTQIDPTIRPVAEDNVGLFVAQNRRVRPVCFVSIDPVDVMCEEE